MNGQVQNSLEDETDLMHLNGSDHPKRKPVSISEKPSNLLSKEGFALYVGKTPAAVVAMAKAGKLPAFYMADPLKAGGYAELWISRKEWDKYADQLVEDAPDEWHGWKDRISAGKPCRGVRSTEENS